MGNYNKHTNKEHINSLHYNTENAYLRAEKRVKKQKGFYIHLLIFLSVKIFLTAGKIIRNVNNGETFSEAFLDSATFGVFGLWGLILLIHFLNVFGKNLFFGHNWEKRKIEEYMQQEEEKY